MKSRRAGCLVLFALAFIVIGSFYYSLFSSDREYVTVRSIPAAAVPTAAVPTAAASLRPRGSSLPRASSRPSSRPSFKLSPAATAESSKTNPASENKTDDLSYKYIGNKNTYKFHRLNCSYLPQKRNRVYFHDRQEAVDWGGSPCQKCMP